MTRGASALVGLALLAVALAGCTGVELVTYEDETNGCIAGGFEDVAPDPRADASTLIAMVSVKASDCLRNRRGWECSNVEAVCTDPAGDSHDLVEMSIDMLQRLAETETS